MRIRGTKAKQIQQHLHNKGYNLGAIDGIPGSKTYQALNTELQARSNELPDDWKSFSNNRKLIVYIQLMSKDLGIDTGKIDGYWGPQTEYAYNAYVFTLEFNQPPSPWRDTPPPTTNPNAWPHQEESQLRAFYGDVEQNQTQVDLPYTHRLSWDKSHKINRFTCHEKVSDSIHRVLSKVLDHYGEHRIKELRLDLWGGCLNNRRKRGGTSLSTHAWGIAIDYDPAHNRFGWGRSRAQFARPEYEKWWQFWEEEGWVSLGRSANFDWMHIQAARLE